MGWKKGQPVPNDVSISPDEATRETAPSQGMSDTKKGLIAVGAIAGIGLLLWGVWGLSKPKAVVGGFKK